MPTFWRVCIINGYWILSKAFSASIEMIIWFFFFNLLISTLSFLMGTFFFFNKFIYLFLGVLGLRFCARAFSSCGERGPLSSSRCAGLSLSRPLLWSTGSWSAGSVVVAYGPSCSAACGIFPDQCSNLCPLHWQADSQPLRQQGSPDGDFYGITWNVLKYVCIVERYSIQEAVSQNTKLKSALASKQK